MVNNKQTQKHTTMKTTTAQNRLAKLNLNKGTKAYQFVNEIINGAKTIRPCYTSGSGRFTTNLDYTRDVENLLDLIGVKYISGNDAPRGGATGNFIKITTKIN